MCVQSKLYLFASLKISSKSRNYGCETLRKKSWSEAAKKTSSSCWMAEREKVCYKKVEAQIAFKDNFFWENFQWNQTEFFILNFSNVISVLLQIQT